MWVAINRACCLWSLLAEPWWAHSPYLTTVTVDVARFALTHFSVFFQATVTLLGRSTIRSSPQGQSNLLRRTLASCWLLQENSRATWPKAVSSLHGMSRHGIVLFEHIKCRIKWWTCLFYFAYYYLAIILPLVIIKMTQLGANLHSISLSSGTNGVYIYISAVKMF